MKGFIRHPAHIPIEVALTERSPAEMPEPSPGGGGLWFAAEECWEVGSLLAIRIPITRPAFEDTGRVAWCRPVNSHYEVGITLMSPEAAYRARMVEQICHIDEYRHYVRRREGRRLTSDEAAREWIARYAKDFPSPLS